MGSNEVDKSSKKEKEAREQKFPAPMEPAVMAPTAVPPDWSMFQAYPPMPPHGFLAPNPQAHPYMWGVQQFIPPYANPPHPYVAMYPHGGVYAHPSMTPGAYPFSPFPMPIPEASTNAPSNIEVDGRASEGKEKLPVKRSKGSLGSLNMIIGKNNEPGKTPGASANGVYSKSADSASEGSNEGTDSNSQNDSQTKSNGRPVSAEPSQNGSATHSSQNGGSYPPHTMVNQTMAMVQVHAPTPVSGVPGTTTNLNVGMDYWSTAPSSDDAALRRKMAGTPVAVGMAASGSRDSAQSQHWNERELKRQKRKQSNRESARRSRLRKQAECDELAQRTETLNEENASLRAEVARIRSEYEQLRAQNASLKERLGELPVEEDPRYSRNDQLSVISSEADD